MPDGMNEHRESVIVIGVDLTVCILGRIRVQGLAGEGTYLGVLRWTKIYLGRDGDDSFRYTGVRPSKPENLSKMGTLMDDDGVERYLVCLGSVVCTTSVHRSLSSKGFARVSSIASGAENVLRREHSRKQAYLLKRPCGCANLHA